MVKTMTRSICAALAALLLSCGAEPEQGGSPQALTDLDFVALAASSEAIEDPLIAMIEGARGSIDLAISTLPDTRIAQALLDARDQHGVEVRVVTDRAAESDEGVALLSAAGVPITLGDGELVYLPEPTLGNVLELCEEFDGFRACTVAPRGTESTDPNARQMVRPDDYNLMSHNFAVVDEVKVWIASTPPGDRSTIYSGFYGHSQDLAIALTSEFQQMFGGVFSTTLDNFNGPNKSTTHGIVYDSRIPDARKNERRQLEPGYLSRRGLIGLEFNPQQRLVKEVIDEIYMARSSVWVMADAVDHEFIANALAYKARAGFDVRVLVSQEGAVPEKLEGVARRLPRDRVPTIVVIDHAGKQGGATEWPRTAMVMTHPFLRETPFAIVTPEELGDPQAPANVVRIFPSDLFADGALWTLRDLGAQAQDPNSRAAEIGRDLGALWDDAQLIEGGSQ